MLALMCRKTGWTFMCVPAGKPLPSRATAKVWKSLWCVFRPFADPGCGGSHRRFRDDRRGGACGRQGAAGGGQSGADPALRAGGWQARQDRPDRCWGDRHFAEAVKPAPAGLPDEQARLLGELVSRRRQIIEMIVAERQREKRARISASAKALPVISRCSRRNCRRSMMTSTRWCAARRSGATRRSC